MTNKQAEAGNPLAGPLDDKWDLDGGRVVINGTQAIARVLLAQAGLDRRNGLKTAGYISGYRGSPLGNLDTTLWSVAARLKAANIVFHPGVNEDIAATAVRGTQQLDALPGARYDGVFAAWYGKGPGVDRSGDALKHGNYVGTHRNGGVLAFYGDDHAAKSSTVAHQSEQAMAANLIPSLYPANVQELLEYGLIGYALSRYSGSWVGIKCVNEVAEQTASVDLDIASFSTIAPSLPADLPQGLHAAVMPFNPLREEQIVIEHRLPLVQAFVRANNLDREVISAPERKLGLVCAGKSYNDVRAALRLLGLTPERAAQAGISLYKVGCIWPLEPVGLEDFARGQATLFVVEEKKSFLEQQIAATLINAPQRPLVIGKNDEDGAPLLSSSLQLDPADIAIAIARRMERLGLLTDEIRLAEDSIIPLTEWQKAPPSFRRGPYFCSGCPHNRSTQLPAGSVGMAGIGCHGMASFLRPDKTLPPTQMGGEGANWIGLAPFTDTQHIFQNMGDGTYFHSGLLAIRAAVASRANITYKILYNDAVAMTGGQPVDGSISVVEIARQVQDEGVGRIVLLSDDPGRYGGESNLPAHVEIGHRDTLDEVQKSLRTTPGCTVLIYEQTCAAEKRRRRKRGTFPDPAKRLFISKEVCEGCGDCSAQSTCVSLIPVDTEFGQKRAIDQASCNKDYSCINGFCPSFITITGAALRKPGGIAVEPGLLDDLPTPARAKLDHDCFNLMIAGIGGSGVVTVGAVIGMAAHLEGLAVSTFDLTGLSQKNGAVYSHVRIGRQPDDLDAQRIGRRNADVLLGFDLVAATSPEAASTLDKARTRALINSDVTPTVAFQFDRDFKVDSTLLLGRLRRELGAENVDILDATSLAAATLGDVIGTNLFVVGIAVQRGMLPVGADAIERAVALNAVSVPFNLKAFRLGRLYAERPEVVRAWVGSDAPDRSDEPAALATLIQRRVRHLTDFQDARLADRYRRLVGAVHEREASVIPGSDTLAMAVARNYAKLLSYKDEYEVARLLSSETLRREIESAFEDGGRIAFNMAPPLLPSGTVNGRPKKREFGSWILPVLRAMARLKVLRGSRLDPFGYTAERRLERCLIEEYEDLVRLVLAKISPRNHAQAVALLTAADQVRGYGPVKKTAIDAYHARLGKLKQEFWEAGQAEVTAVEHEAAIAQAM